MNKYIEDKIKEGIEKFVLPSGRSIVRQCVIGNATHKGTVNLCSSAIPLFNWVKDTLTDYRQQLLEEVEESIPELKVSDVNKGGGQYGHPEIDFDTGYDQALTEVKQIINKMK